MSLRSPASCSMTGPIIRHGPHHGAQKSTTAGPCAISFRKSASFRVIGWPSPSPTAVTGGKYLRILAVDRERRRRGIGSALLRDAESRGARVIAAEPGNYFTPGILESVVPFFTKRGFHETARTHNLIVDEFPTEIPE